DLALVIRRSSYFDAYVHRVTLHSFPTRRSSDLTPSRARTLSCPRSGASRGTRADSASPSRSRARVSRTYQAVPGRSPQRAPGTRSEEHTSELQSRRDLVCRLLLEKKNTYEIQSR